MATYLIRHSPVLSGEVEVHAAKNAVLPLLGCLALNMLAYYGSRLFNLSMTSYDLSLPLDHRIPLVPPFIAALHAVVCILVVRLHGHCRRQPGAPALRLAGHRGRAGLHQKGRLCACRQCSRQRLNPCHNLHRMN